MKIKFKRIALENFCGIKSLDVDLPDKALICGANGLGKSTIQNAIMWILTNQLADGSSPDGKIRPHDANGVDIDNVEIKVGLDVEFDGTVFTLTKINKQKWTKSSTDQQKKMSGNNNEFYINGIFKNERDFKAFIEQFIVIDDFKFCTNPRAFLKLNTAKRREKIMSLFGNKASFDGMLENNEKYKSIAKDLKVGTVDELISATKRAIAGLKEKQKAIPVRIDELNHQKEDVDISELIKNKEEINNKIKDLTDKKSNLLSLNSEYSDLSSQIMELKFKQGDVEREANKAVEEKARNKRDIRQKIDSVDAEIANIQAYIRNAEIIIAENEEKMQNYRNEISAVNKEEFDEKNTICPTCKQKLPEEQVSVIKETFKSNKQAKIKSINNKGVALKQVNEQTKQQIDDYNKKIAEKCVAKKELENALDNVGRIELIDAKSTPEWLKIQKEINDLEEKQSKVKRFDVSEFDKEISNLNSELITISNQIAVAENQNFDERIEELQQEAMDVEQKIANEEKKKKLLEDFNKERIELLTEPVNSHFNIIKFKLFKPLIKDKNAFEDVCELLVNGTSYDANLNVGFKILADVDLCQAFQKAYDLHAPIFIDNIESLDEWRIPKVDGQLIMMKKTDDKTLEIKEVSNG